MLRLVNLVLLAPVLHCYIKIHPAHRTTVHGLYPCGNITTRMSTVANEVSMSTTGLMVNKNRLQKTFDTRFTNRD